MKVERSRAASTPVVRRESSVGHSGFADNLHVSDTPAVATVSAAPMLSGIEGLYALQDVEPALNDDRAAARGDEILDRLQELQRGLLLGRIGRDQISQLAQLSSAGAAEAANPKLRAVLMDIDLRAKVELAKLESAES